MRLGIARNTFSPALRDMRPSMTPDLLVLGEKWPPERKRAVVDSIATARQSRMYCQTLPRWVVADVLKSVTLPCESTVMLSNICCPRCRQQNLDGSAGGGLVASLKSTAQSCKTVEGVE